jgi:signal transduction histidine kinase
VAAGIVLFCVALAWWASVRLVEARGRASVLETETRHFRELSQAAAGLAHETRNPLGLIRGWTQRLADVDMEDGQRQQHSRSVIEECDRVTARINQFLTFARPCDPEITRVSAREVIDELAGILQPDLEAKNLSLECDNPLPTASIRADRELFRQVLFNLLQNAIQFSPPGNAVRITMRRLPNGCYRIAVADRGPGVSEDAVESLFTPYFTTRADGTGLGLAIVRRIATAHGWEADYEPRPDGGAVFSLRGIHE